ncbi:MAG: hypothetical protein R2853_09525 [Thermomicrobiales bacterium]
MLLKHTWHVASLVVLLAGMVAVGLTHAAPVASQDDADAKIEQAMSAAPASIGADATIYDLNVDDAGNFIVLREGTNGWSCFPDAPGTPSLDPMCLDQTWMNWLAALIAQKAPDTKVPGLAYMLQGGSDASNTDPYATEPAAGDEWVSSPPHVMLLLPGELDQSVFTTDHASGGPYIMWAGTPYEHIMMPVAEGTMGEMGEMAGATPAP